MRTWISGMLSVWVLASTSACGDVGFAGSNLQADAGTPKDAGGLCDPPACGVRAGTLVFFGGDDQTAPHDETWMFDGASWTKVATPKAPLARDGAAIATLGNRVVLFGGSSTALASAPLEPLDDTWIFDGKTWTQISTKPHPPARALATMATLDGKVVLFGGTTGGADATAFNDTWTFDGTTWTEVLTPTSPPPYVSDNASNLTLYGDRLVLVSGYTWAFDSTTWVEIPAGPTPANTTNGAGLAALNQRLILYSVGSEEGEGAATWQLDGLTWGKIPFPPNTPDSDFPEAEFLRPMFSVGDHVLLVAPILYAWDGAPMDVWSFDGAVWTNLKIPNGPPPRYYPAWAYVP